MSEASKIASSLQTRYPRRSVSYFVASYVSLQSRDLQSALKSISSAIERDPQHGTYYLFRGLCHKKLGASKEFLNDVTLARQQPPSQGTDPIQIEKMYGIALFDNDMKREATKVFTVLRSKGHLQLPGLFSLWFCCSDMNMPASCLTISREIVKIDKKSEMGRRLLARSLVQAGRVDAAIRILYSIPSKDRDSYWHLDVGVAQEYKHQYKDAVASYELALRMSPGQFETALRLALLLATFPDSEFGDINRSLRLTRTCLPQLTYGRSRAISLMVEAVALLKSNKGDAAMDAIRKASKIEQAGPQIKARLKVVQTMASGKSSMGGREFYERTVLAPIVYVGDPRPK